MPIPDAKTLIEPDVTARWKVESSKLIDGHTESQVKSSEFQNRTIPHLKIEDLAQWKDLSQELSRQVQFLSNQSKLRQQQFYKQAMAGLAYRISCLILALNQSACSFFHKIEGLEQGQLAALKMIRARNLIVKMRSSCDDNGLKVQRVLAYIETYFLRDSWKNGRARMASFAMANRLLSRQLKKPRSKIPLTEIKKIASIAANASMQEISFNELICQNPI